MNITNTPALRAGLRKALQDRGLAIAHFDRLYKTDGSKYPNARTVQRWLNGRTKSIREDTLIQFAEALEIDYTALWEEMDQEPEYVAMVSEDTGTPENSAEEKPDVPEEDGRILSEETSGLSLSALLEDLNLTPEDLPNLSDDTEASKELGEEENDDSEQVHILGNGFRARPLTWILLLVVLGGLTLAWFALTNRWFTAAPANERISYLERSQDQTRVILKNDNGTPVRTINVGGEILTSVLIDVDGEQYAIVGVHEQSNQSGKSGFVIAFNMKGEEIWHFNMYDPDFINDKSGFYIVNRLDKARFWGEDKEYIVAMAREPMYATTRITLLDPATGEDVYSFWNAGRIHEFGLLITDLNADGSSEILLGGSQNNLAGMISSQLGLTPGGFFFGSALLLEPQKYGTFCSPGLPQSAPVPKCPWRSIKWMVLGHPFYDAPSIELKNINYTNTMGAAIGGIWNIIYYLDYEGNIVDTFPGKPLITQGVTKVPPLLVLKMTETGAKAELLHSGATDEATFRVLYDEDQMKIIRQFLQFDTSKQ